MVQKNIYFYWGNHPMSFLRYMTLKSFNHFNPEWKINLIYNSQEAKNAWTTGEHQDNIFYKGRDFRTELSSIKNLSIIDLKYIFPRDYSTMSNVHIKDTLNWYLLSTRSCAVADMDIIFFAPIDNCKGIDMNSHVNICNFDFFRNYMPVSFMLSDITEDGKNKFYENIYQNSIVNYNPQIYESCGNNCIKYPSIYNIIDTFKELKINKMDHMVIFPFVDPNPANAGSYCWNKDNSNLFSNNTIGVHWYAGQPISQKYNNTITIENFRTFDNTITNLIKNIIN